MASTVDQSCRLWDHHIQQPGALGDCEHLRSTLGRSQLLNANELAWLTDSCPHESLPAVKRVLRQWFRLVTSDVSLWYEKHSTKNRLGVEAPCHVDKADKFGSVQS